MPKDNKNEFEETNMKDYEEQYEELLEEEKEKTVLALLSTIV